MDEFIQNPTFTFVSNLWWNIVMDDWTLDENHLVSKGQHLQHCKPVIPQRFYKDDK